MRRDENTNVTREDKKLNDNELTTDNWRKIIKIYVCIIGRRRTYLNRTEKITLRDEIIREETEFNKSPPFPLLSITIYLIIFLTHNYTKSFMSELALNWPSAFLNFFCYPQSLDHLIPLHYSFSCPFL